MQNLIEKQRINGYSDLKGAIIKGSIPVTQEFINDVIRETILNNNELVRQLQVIVKEQNRIDVNLTIQKWILSRSFNLELHIERKINFPNSPKVKVWLPTSHEFLVSVVETLTNILGFLPESIKVTGRLIEVDLKVILQKQKMGELVQFIKFAEIEGQRGKMLFNFWLEID